MFLFKIITIGQSITNFMNFKVTKLVIAFFLNSKTDGNEAFGCQSRWIYYLSSIQRL